MHAKALLIIKLALLAVILPLHSLASSTQPAITLHGFAKLSSPPFAWVDPCTGKLTGSSQHILKKAFKENNAQLIIQKPLPPFSNQWHAKGRQLMDGSLDIFYGNNLDIYRLDQTLITHHRLPATIIESGLFSLKQNNLQINSLNQVKGKKIGLPSPLTSFVTATGLKKDILNNLDIQDKLAIRDAINMLIDGELDYIIGGKYRYNNIARKMKENTQLEFSPIKELSRNLYFWHRIDNKNKAVFDNVVETLERYRNNGYVEYMNKSYFLTWNNQPDCSIANK